MARVVTDGHAGYKGKRPWHAAARRDPADQGRAERERRHPELPQDDIAPQALALGTHAGEVHPKHLHAYLDEYAFRHKRRKSNGVGRIAARVIERR